MQEVFEKIKQFIHKEIDRTSSFVEHDTQCNILHFVEELEEEYQNIPSDEYINRQQAIDAVTRSYSYESERMTALQELPVVNIPKNNGWIPVEERLPEKKMEVLICNEIGEMTSTWYIPWAENSKTFKRFAHRIGGYETVAWQPLPEPYQPKGDKE